MLPVSVLVSLHLSCSCPGMQLQRLAFRSRRVVFPCARMRAMVTWIARPVDRSCNRCCKETHLTWVLLPAWHVAYKGSLGYGGSVSLLEVVSNLWMVKSNVCEGLCCCAWMLCGSGKNHSVSGSFGVFLAALASSDSRPRTYCVVRCCSLCC